jgi:hypothetical protein
VNFFLSAGDEATVLEVEFFFVGRVVVGGMATAGVVCTVEVVSSGLGQRATVCIQALWQLWFSFLVVRLTFARLNLGRTI